jgi:hypothetical protein
MFPSHFSFDEGETWAITRIRLAQYLGQLPSAIDTMPYSDVAAVVEVMRADQEVEAARRNK